MPQLSSLCGWVGKPNWINTFHPQEKLFSLSLPQVGLSWQSLHLLYRDANSPSSEAVKEYILLTGSEAVSRGIVDSIRASAAACPGFMRSIPLNKDDEARVEAIEKELIKLGSEVCCYVVPECGDLCTYLCM